MVCKHCGEKTNVCPYCTYGIDADIPLEEFFVCPNCGKKIYRCAYCGCSLEFTEQKLSEKSILIQKIIGYVAISFIILGIIYLFYYDHVIGF